MMKMGKTAMLHDHHDPQKKRMLQCRITNLPPTAAKGKKVMMLIKIYNWLNNLLLLLLGCIET